MKRSIRVRLLVWVVALLLPLSAVAGWLLIQVFGNRLLHDIDVALQEEAETIAELLTTPASPDAVADLLARISGETDSGPHKYIVVTRNGATIAEAPRDAGAVLASGKPQLRIVRYQSRDGALIVSIGVSGAAAVHAKQRLTSLLVAGIPLMLGLFGSGLWLVVGRALRPLEQASQHMDGIAADTLAVRVPVDNRDDEVGRMVTVLNRMLERLEHAVGQLRRFTADAAHELRTPLTVLRTGLEVALARERPAAEYRAALAEALTGTDRLCRLAGDLLTLARLDAAGAPRAAVPVDLAEMLHELGDAAADIVAVAAPGDLWVHGNAGDLYRLFNNLIDNAVRHGGNGAATERQIRITAQRAADHIAVTVSDDGPGIPPHELQRVFDRFYRGHTQPSDGSGTGLGLSIAQEIARTHGGQITVANRAGNGCAVTVTLPAAPSPEPARGA
ncbi:MAG TPA: ATP-binding protein [Candidatus Acidoferrales bacterium]|nr:ATP-binding protein [Candidatus Acidoferrales bacterium]